MNLDVSTLNLALASIVALQVWIVKELYHLRGAMATLPCKVSPRRPKDKALVCSLFLIVLAVLTAGCISTPGGGGGIFTRQPDGTNYIVNPDVIRTIEQVRGVSEGFGPVGSAVSLGLGAAAGVLALIAKAKTRRANLVPALIAGIEAAGSADVKKSVQKVAQVNGVESELRALVRQLTE